MNLFWDFMWKMVVGCLLLAAGSMAGVFFCFWLVSFAEHQAGRPGIFDLVVVPINAPLWLLLLASNSIVNGMLLGRWAILIAVDLARLDDGGYELAVPLPVGKLIAGNIVFAGVGVVLFLFARATVCAGA